MKIRKIRVGGVNAKFILNILIRQIPMIQFMSQQGSVFTEVTRDNILKNHFVFIFAITMATPAWNTISSQTHQ